MRLQNGLFFLPRTPFSSTRAAFAAKIADAPLSVFLFASDFELIGACLNYLALDKMMGLPAQCIGGNGDKTARKPHAPAACASP